LGRPGDRAVPESAPPLPPDASGHAACGGALFETLKGFYGTNDSHFTLRSDEVPGVTRSFDHFLDASAENGRSRIYLGIHWNFDSLAGQQCGREVADYVFAHAFAPKAAPALAAAPAHPALAFSATEISTS